LTISINRHEENKGAKIPFFASVVFFVLKFMTVIDHSGSTLAPALSACPRAV